MPRRPAPVWQLYGICMASVPPPSRHWRAPAAGGGGGLGCAGAVPKRRGGASPDPPELGRGHRRGHRKALPHPPPRAPKALGQRPPRPWRALLARRVRRWPLESMRNRSTGRASTRTGKDSAFPVPPDPSELGRGHRRGHARRLPHPPPRAPKALGQRLTCPWQALRASQVRRWPLW